jgi:drug/metabolite transporter (DMT)-like permease
MDIASRTRLVLLAALWGGSFLFMRIAAPVLGAIPTAFARVALGALGLALLIGVLRAPRAFKGLFAATLALGVLNSGIPFLMFSLAAKVLPAGYSAILNATTPLMGVLIGSTLFKESVSAWKLVGMGLGLAGVAVLMRAGPADADAAVLLGVGACLVATACYALAGFLTRRWITQRGGLDSKLVAIGSQLGATVLLVPFMAWHATVEPSPAWSAVDAKVWLSMLALGLLCTSLAYVLYFRLIADVGPLKALTVTFLVPPFGVLWGWWLLGEPVSWAHLAGGGLIAVALWMVLRPASS